MTATTKIYWYIKGISVRLKLRHKHRQRIKYLEQRLRIKYLEQLLQDTIISSGADREELLKEAAQYLKERR